MPAASIFGHTSPSTSFPYSISAQRVKSNGRSASRNSFCVGGLMFSDDHGHFDDDGCFFDDDGGCFDDD